ncbi:hypothetical protein [Phytohalomonas tamaricis]|uniref:hypothetical protein n=1 Tax=Phytohalomonas tamaricis TaxID=2081032 RepID=UPI000D0B1873|nr:hypothetical protein [Phytohalomonas tamaricis]
MVTVFWIAMFIAMLAGYGMVRGFSMNVCKKILLMACGAAIAALSEIGGLVAWSLVALLCLSILFLCFFHDRTPRAMPQRINRQTERSMQRLANARHKHPHS